MRRALPVAILVIVLLAGTVGIRVGGVWVARHGLDRLSKQTGIAFSAGHIKSRLGRIRLQHVTVGDRGSMREVLVDYDLAQLLLFRLTVAISVQGADLQFRPEDRMAKSRGAGHGAPKRLRLTQVTLTDAHVRYTDLAIGLVAHAILNTTWRPRAALQATFTDAALTLEAGPKTSAERLDVSFAPGAKLPRVELHSASAAIGAGLELSDIVGWIGPRPDGALELALSGSYGGAGERLWDASGWIRPDTKTAEVRLRAERFHLDKIAPILAELPLANLENAEVGGDLTIRRGESNGGIQFEGAVSASGITFSGASIASTPVANFAVESTLRGSFNPVERAFSLEEATVRVGSLTALLEAQGEHLGQGAVVSAKLRVPPVGCQMALNAIPQALIPKLVGFRLGGTFEANLEAQVDWAAIEQLRVDDRWKRDRKLLQSAVTLKGKVGLAGCQVLSAPIELDARRLAASFAQTAEVSPGHFSSFVIGPENAEFVPLETISPYVVGSILTTEDSRFFNHHGFIGPEMRTALARDLVERRFAYGASSITMQMVKNVLLSHEKTLARKFQEMFLTWYVESALPKERILEIYLNAIEFGPGIFGIGRAARHYFGKNASDLTPLEAAFFSSILPSPKRRYEHYCHGQLSPRWTKYLPRILKRMVERGRLTEAEYSEALVAELTFDRTEAKPEKECLEIVRRWVGATEEEPLDELELPFFEPTDDEAYPEDLPVVR